MTVTLTAEPVPPQRPPKVRTKGGSTLFDRQIMRVAFAGAVRKLDPRLMVRNPVMLIVEVGSVLPAAAPTILTGMRISMGIAWLVIVAAEMLVGNLGIGYFVWNEWNNLSITNVITSILVIGLVGMLLDQGLARLARAVSFPE